MDLNILPIAIEFANERCFSENHTKLNFVGMNKINVCAKAHKNCPRKLKSTINFSYRKNTFFFSYQSLISQIVLNHRILIIH